MPNLAIAIADKRSARFADIANNRLQLVEYDPKIFWREQHALAVDHILDTLLVPAGTRAACPEPEPWAGQRLGAQVLGKSRSGTPKRCFRRSFLSISTHTRNQASHGRQPTPEE